MNMNRNSIDFQQIRYQCAHNLTLQSIQKI